MKKFLLIFSIFVFTLIFSLNPAKALDEDNNGYETVTEGTTIYKYKLTEENYWANYYVLQTDTNDANKTIETTYYLTSIESDTCKSGETLIPGNCQKAEKTKTIRTYSDETQTIIIDKVFYKYDLKLKKYKSNLVKEYANYSFYEGTNEKKVVTVRKYNAKGKLNLNQTKEYSIEGKLIKVSNLNKKGKKENTTTYKYNKKGKLVGKKTKKF